MRVQGARATLLITACHLAMAAALLLWSWHEWADPTNDSGFNLYTFWRLAEGQVLYRDLVYFHGPLSPALGALVFRLFGASLTALAISSAVLVGLLAQGIFLIFRRVADFPAALACSTFFLVAIAFSQLLPTANYNFITPYKFELLHGTCLLVALQLALFRPRRKYALAGLCLGASLLLSAEVAATALALALLAAIFEWNPPGSRHFLAAACAAPLVAWLLLLRDFPPLSALALVFRGELVPFEHGKIALNNFYLAVSGLDRPAANAGMLLAAAAGQGLFWGVMALLSVAMRRLPLAARWAAGAAIPAGLYVYSHLAPSVGPFPWWNFARALPLVAALWLGLSLAAARRAGSSPEGRARASALAGWGMFACGLVLKIVLKCSVDFYGVFLAMPALLASVAALTFLLPRWLERNWEGGGALFRAAGFGIVVAVALSSFTFSSGVFEAKSLVVGAGRDSMTGWPLSPAYRGIAATLAWVERNTLPGSTLLVLPEGQSINYLARRVQPGSYALSPVNFLLLGEEPALAEWSTAPPDFVVVRSHDNSEFGLPAFGHGGYGEKTSAWVRANYESCVQFGDSPWEERGYGIQILKRRLEPSAAIDETRQPQRKIGC